MPRRLGTVGLVLALLVLLLPSAVRAQGPLQIEVAPPIGHFPDEISFPVTAESSAADVVNLELSYWVTGSPYTSSRWSTFAPAQRVEASYRLDTQVEHYLPGTEFHYYWTAVDAAGNSAVSPEYSFVYVDDRFPWQELTVERISVYWYEGEPSFAQTVMDTAQQALDRLEQDAGVEAVQQIKIFLYAGHSDLMSALGPNSPEWIGGQALPAMSLIVANLSPDDEWTGEIGRMIPHELSHVVLYQATHNPYAGNPNWLEEGIAVHNQEVADADFPFYVEQAARDGTLIPLRALSASFPTDADLALLSYAESASVIEFILERYGEEGLSALVDIFAQGETAEAAVEQALGVTLEELDNAWRATLPQPERTPQPAATPIPPQAPGTFCISVGVLAAALAVLVRRHRTLQTEPVGEDSPAEPPDGAAS